MIVLKLFVASAIVAAVTGGLEGLFIDYVGRGLFHDDEVRRTRSRFVAAIFATKLLFPRFHKVFFLTPWYTCFGTITTSLVWRLASGAWPSEVGFLFIMGSIALLMLVLD